MMWWRTLAIRIAAAAWLVAGAVFAAAPPNIVFYFIGRAIIIITRSVHELVWAIIFVIAVGLGPLAGILALGIRGIGFVSKVVSEEIEAIDMGPVDAMRATGAKIGRAHV